MIAQAEQLLQRGSSVTSSLLPAIFRYFQPVASDRRPADDPVGAQQREDPL